MPLDFPNSPSVGQTYTLGNKTWIYDGTVWTSISSAAILALTTNTLAQFASTTSSQLAGIISDETGTGSLVFANAPTLNGIVNVTGDINISGSGDFGSVTDNQLMTLMGAI